MYLSGNHLMSLYIVFWMFHVPLSDAESTLTFDSYLALKQESKCYSESYCSWSEGDNSWQAKLVEHMKTIINIVTVIMAYAVGADVFTLENSKVKMNGIEALAVVNCWCSGGLGHALNI